MPLHTAEYYMLHDSMTDDGILVQVVGTLHSADGSEKLIQIPAGDHVGITFETGRYRVEESIDPGRAQIENLYFAGPQVDKVCLSTEIGCRRGCAICESGRPTKLFPGEPPVKLYRSLTGAEIVQQALNAVDVAPLLDHRRLTFAFMGMGEAFDNIDAVINAIQRLSQLEPRADFTISTIGHKLGHKDDEFGIKDLADMVASGKFERPIRLHISLHGSDDAQRRKIVPYAPPLNDLLDAAEYFAVTSNTNVKLNYVLVEGINASEEDAHKIGAALRGRKGLVLKLSTLNAEKRVVGKDAADDFETIVQGYGVETYRFTSLGQDIVGRCGEFAKNVVVPTVLVRVQDPDGNLLLLQRSKDAPDYPGKWSFVSGKLNKGDEDDPVFAALREVREETGYPDDYDRVHRRIGEAQISSTDYIGTYTYIPPSCKGPFHLVHVFDYHLDRRPEIILNRENTAYAWVRREELSSYNLVDPLLDGELDVFPN